MRIARSKVLLARGDLVGAAADSELALTMARRAKDPQALVPAIVARILIETTVGNVEASSELMAELDRISTSVVIQTSRYLVTWWTAHAAGLSKESSAWPGRDDTPVGSAARAVEEGDPDRAAELFATMGARPNEAYARLLAAERDFAAGDRAAGERQLERALTFYREVRATYFIERAESLRAAIRPEG